MKSIGRALSAFAALLTMLQPATAATFFYTGSIADYLIPMSGIYSFTVAGAQGGDDSGVGGGGAVISGNIYFSVGTYLSVLVGGAGKDGNGDSAGGGGGMSFLAQGSSPIIVAGGGGGTEWFGGNVGGDAQIGTSIGGIEGQGGTSGAGWYSDGSEGQPSAFVGGGGKSSPTFAGGAGNDPFQAPLMVLDSTGGAGGFGGGGGGGYGCGGGGGGYSGGSTDAFCNGYGGGSYISPLATDIVAVAGGNKAPILCDHSICYTDLLPADGFINLSFVTALPEPSTWAFMMLGFGGVGCSLRIAQRRQARTARDIGGRTL